MNKNKVYCAGGWFTPNQDKVQTIMENVLRGREELNVYYPRHDGVKLESNQIHDPGMREKVFKDNISHIDTADLVIANLDGRDGYQDTGTCYEVGYAMAQGIPVIGFQLDGGNMMYHMKALSTKMVMCTGIDELNSVLDSILNGSLVLGAKSNITGDKVLFIAPDDKEENIKNANNLASILIENFNGKFKWVDNTSNPRIGEDQDELFNDVGLLVAVIDDRHPIVSWSLGQAYCRGIPIISYTNYDYGVNIMLLCSILNHVKGVDEFKNIIQKIKRFGINSIEKGDFSNIKAF